MPYLPLIIGIFFFIIFILIRHLGAIILAVLAVMLFMRLTGGARGGRYRSARRADKYGDRTGGTGGRSRPSWFHSDKDAEEVTLPSDALRKDDSAR